MRRVSYRVECTIYIGAAPTANLRLIKRCRMTVCLNRFHSYSRFRFFSLRTPTFRGQRRLRNFRQEEFFPKGLSASRYSKSKLVFSSSSQTTRTTDHDRYHYCHTQTSQDRRVKIQCSFNNRVLTATATF